MPTKLLEAEKEEARLFKEFQRISQSNGDKISKLVKEVDEARRKWGRAYEGWCDLRRGMSNEK